MLAGGGNLAPLDLAFDTFNASQIGAFGPDDALLDALLEASLAAHASVFTRDVVCVNGIDSEKNEQARIAAAAHSFSAEVATDQATRPEDPTDRFGNVPAPRTIAACVGADADAALVDCVRDNGSSRAPGDDTGRVEHRRRAPELLGGHPQAALHDRPRQPRRGRRGARHCR